MMMVNKPLVLTYLYLLIYVLLSSGVILYNKWVLSPKYFNFPLPITLTMIHMGFSGAVAFFLIRVFKVVSPVKMTLEIYITCVVPISAFFAASLWFGNTAYLYISVAFIQMLKALMPVQLLSWLLCVVLTKQGSFTEEGLDSKTYHQLYYIAPCRKKKTTLWCCHVQQLEKLRMFRASQLPESIPDRMTKVNLLESS
ncbi:hypothetical protein NC652_024538 [Populus alba x Populus x berolinensis]|nr:hypothetical protein NC652_024538 [Populus alba x Populus x berolinensis]